MPRGTVVSAGAPQLGALMSCDLPDRLRARIQEGGDSDGKKGIIPIAVKWVDVESGEEHFLPVRGISGIEAVAIMNTMLHEGSISIQVAATGPGRAAQGPGGHGPGGPIVRRVI